MIPATLLPLVILFALLASVMTLVNTSFGLSVLIFSMLLSPEIDVAELPQRAVSIRVDDILLFTVFITWLAKIALFKEISLFKKTSLSNPIALFIICCIFSTLVGTMMGTVKGKGAFFFILKYVEYFLLYFMFVNVVEDRDQLKRLLRLALLTCFIICLYAFSRYGKDIRVSAPFEGQFAEEPASLGGYLLLMMGLVIGLWAYATSRAENFFYTLLLLLIPPALAISTSRGAFIGVLPMYLTILFLTKRRKIFLILILVISPLLVVAFVPPQIIQFTREAFQGETVRLGESTFELGYSGTSRLFLWRGAFERFKRNPLLGVGITGVGLVDNQYIRFLAETGILGCLVFFWLLLRIFIMGYRNFRDGQDGLEKGLALGFLGGFVGLLVFGLGANSFIIVRIMEPFWFIAAIVSVFPHLRDKTMVRAA